MPKLDKEELIISTTRPETLSACVAVFYHPEDKRYTQYQGKKAEVPVEVLCFDAADFESFGFNWFAMTEITAREQVFFGNICIDDLTAYEQTAYAGQANGIQLDMPAIFKVVVLKNGVEFETYSNEAWLIVNKLSGCVP